MKAMRISYFMRVHSHSRTVTIFIDDLNDGFKVYSFLWWFVSNPWYTIGRAPFSFVNGVLIIQPIMTLSPILWRFCTPAAFSSSHLWFLQLADVYTWECQFPIVTKQSTSKHLPSADSRGSFSCPSGCQALDHPPRNIRGIWSPGVL